MTHSVSRRAVVGAAFAAPALAAAGAAIAQAPAAAPAPPPPVTGPQMGKPATKLTAPYPVVGSIVRLDPALDALIDVTSPVEMVQDGYAWCEGPCWVGGADGHLFASDPRANRIYTFSSKDGPALWMEPSGLQGQGWAPNIREPGSNGLALGRGGLLIANSGGRSVDRVDLKTKARTVLADRFEGKRFNSPNDLVLHPGGGVFFTDPPYGLLGVMTSPDRELDFTGVFRLNPDNSVTLIDKSLSPNGIAISPSGDKLYATDRTGWVVWDLDKAGNASNRRVFIGRDSGVMGGDGMKIDTQGNLWASSNDGISIFNPAGKRIGIIKADQVISNCEFGADGYVYMTSNVRLIRAKAKAKKIIRANA